MTKTKYETFDFAIDYFASLVAKRHLLKKKCKSKTDFINIIKEVIPTSKLKDIMIGDTLGDTIVEEYNWLFNTPKNIIFPLDSDLLYNIEKIKYDIEKSKFVFPFKHFVLAIPQDFRLKEKKLKGVLISIDTRNNFNNNKNKIIEKLGLQSKSIIDTVYDDEDPHKDELIVVNYHMDDQDGINYRLEIVAKSFNEVLNYKSYEEYKEKIPTIQKNGFLSADLDEQESRFQFDLIRLIAGVLVYIQATKENSLLLGLPSKFMKFKTSHFLTKDITNIKLGMPNPNTENKNHNSPKDHYRNWSIRTLRHKKYYQQEEHKDKEPGSRMVFVSDCWVGKEITPNTAI